MIAYVTNNKVVVFITLRGGTIIEGAGVGKITKAKDRFAIIGQPIKNKILANKVHANCN